MYPLYIGHVWLPRKHILYEDYIHSIVGLLFTDQAIEGHLTKKVELLKTVFGQNTI